MSNTQEENQGSSFSRSDNTVHSTSIESCCAEHTRRIGRALGEHAQPGDILLLQGDLGAGKTTLTQGILWGLGSDEYARSPTFVLVTEYEGRIPMYHVDLYRLDNIQDMSDLGLDEYLYGDGVTVVEWANKGTGLFPEDTLKISLITTGEETRNITFEYVEDRHKATIDALTSISQNVSE